MDINKNIELEEYLFRGLKYIEDMFNLPYILNLNASEEAIKIDIIDPQSNRLIEVIPLDKDMVNKLFEELNLPKLDRLLINTVLSRIEDFEYDDFYYPPHITHQAVFPSTKDDDSATDNTDIDTPSSFELQNDKVVYKGESYSILQHIADVKKTSNGYLFNRFYNRNQFFKWIKENSEESDVEAATLGGASWAVVDCEQEHSSECWFIEVYTLDNVSDIDWAAELLDAGSAFFLADGKGNIYLVNTNID